jgi:putative transposase
MVMYNVVTNPQTGLGTRLEIVNLTISTSKTRKHTGSLKQMGEKKRQKSRQKSRSLGNLKPPTSQKKSG